MALGLGVNAAGLLKLDMRMTSPGVYLDTSPLIEIAKDATQAERLRSALLLSGGTLMLSWMHIVELAEPAPRWVHEIEGMVDSLEGRFAFIDLIPTTVIEKENRILAGTHEGAPHLDTELAKYFAEMASSDLTPVSLVGFFSDPDPRIPELREEFLKKYVEMAEALRNRYVADPRAKKILSDSPRGPFVQKATRDLFPEFWHALVRPGMNLAKSSHWRDLFHAVVPIAYCDLVVLDKAWATVAKQVLRRLHAAGHNAEMAHVFRVGEVDGFLETLERWPAVNRDAGTQADQKESGRDLV